MIDTIRVKHAYQKSLCDEELRALGAIQPSGARKHKTWVINPVRGEEGRRSCISVIFPPDNRMHVEVTGSLPKLVFGHNSKLPSEEECWKALTQMEFEINARTGLEFDIQTANVVEIHFARDYHVGDAAANLHTDKLRRRSISRLRKIQIEETLYFQNRGKTRLARIYPKIPEVLKRPDVTEEAIKHARGMLRFEYALSRRSVTSTAKRFGFDRPSTANLVTQEVSSQVMNKLVEDLDFDEDRIEDVSNLEKLTCKYARQLAWNLYTFLHVLARYGENFYRDPRHNLSKAMYQRYLRLCKAAGAWPQAS